MDTLYDESEAVRYEVTTPTSVVVSPLSAKTVQAVQKFLGSQAWCSILVLSACVSDTEAKGASDTRGSLALLCTLLC